MKIESKSWITFIMAFLLLLPFLCIAQSSQIELLSDSEDISARNATTRIYNRTYEITRLDENGVPTGESFQQTRKIIEKADGLCYDASLNASAELSSSPVWEPGVTNFVLQPSGGWKIDTGIARVHIAPYADSIPLVSYSIPFRTKNSEKQFVKKALSLNMNSGALAWHDASTQISRIFSSPQHVPGKASGNRILFENAFSCGDLELVYEKGAFHQNVIVKNPALLPSPSRYDIDAGVAELRVVTDIDDVSESSAEVAALLDEGDGALCVVEGSRISGEDSELIFKSSSEETLCAFAPSRAWVGNDKSNSRFMNKTIKVSSENIKKFTHSEGVPYSYITDNSASGAITLDYEVRSSTAEGSEAWQSGITYWISDEYTVGSGKTLVIEGGAVVKFGATINIDEGNLLIKGAPFNYALFVDDGNDDVGETISNPNSTGRLDFIEITPSSSSDVEVQFGKFAEANIALEFMTNSLAYHNEFEIRDSIFTDVYTGTYGVFDSTGTNDEIRIFNCLFNDFTCNGVGFKFEENQTLRILNCTFDSSGNNYADAVYLDIADNKTLEAFLQNNVYTNLEYGITGTGDLDISSTINYDVSDLEDDRICSNFKNQIRPYNGDVPSGDFDGYYPSENGNFYTCYPGFIDPLIWPSTRNSATTDKFPSGSDYLSRLMSTSTVRPAKIDSTEIGKYNNSQSSELDYISKYGSEGYFIDEDYPDIGFHYDIVHGVVEGLTNMTMTRAFDLEEGSVISFTEYSFWIFDAESNIKGNPVKRNVFNLVASTGDAITDPRKIRDNLIPSGIGITRGTIDFSEFSFLYAGVICYNEDDPLFIRNSVFTENLMGIGAAPEHRKPVYIENCLFTGNARAIYYSLLYSDNGLNLVSNTFSDNAKAV
ncbi:hypothetical protein JW926_06585, partial [Candidatus Sumerlaeota bacterium]|nr:hypothetical protein [Candidatus Sumerlaeota bacterium]